MPLLGIMRCGSTLLLVLFLANLAARSHAQAAKDFTDVEITTVDLPQVVTVQCKGDCIKEAEDSHSDIPKQFRSDIPITDDEDGGQNTQQNTNEDQFTDFCRSPPVVPFADLKDDFLTYTVFTKGAIVSYKCKNGYEYVPGTKETVMCIGDGNWSAPDTFCKVNFCGPLPRLEYGVPKDEYLERTIFTKNTKVLYVCRPGYIRIPYARAVATCLPNLTWSLPTKFCQLKSCGNPGDVDNGEMQAENFVFGSRVTYSCNRGYKMISKRNYRDCLADGIWSNDIPECAVQSCPPPPDTANGHYYPEREEYTYLDSVKYVCSGNLALIGQHSISCTEEGQWSSQAPECRGTCRSVPRYQYAELVEPTAEIIFLEGTILKYRCKEGYEPIPGAVNTVTCLGLRWSPSPEFCKPITCVEPENVPHGRITSGNFVYGSRITYACDTGYKIKNINNRNCLSDQSWSLPIPECEVQTCAIPENVKNGWYSPVIEKYVYNEAVTYNCHEGFQLLGQALITCRSDGRWNNNTPECRGICNAPPDLPYAQVPFSYPNTKTFFAGTTVQYTCKPGYYRDHSFSNSITCLGNFTWSKISEFCKIRTCSTPENVKNGWYGPEREKYTYNDTVTYECFEGFELVGQSSITCLENGRWNYNTPVCRRISCGRPPKVKNAVFEAKDFLFESEAVYKSEEGYKMVSLSDFVKCGLNGSWEGTLPVFEVQTCLPPEDLRNGSYSLKKEEYTYNESVTYKCDTLQLVGKASVTCTYEGKWSSGAPQCRAVCINPPELDFAVVEGEFIHQEFFDIGTSVQYKCRSGFIPMTSKNNNVTCLSDLKWSQLELFCKPVCKIPPELDFAVVEEEFIHQEYFDIGSSVQYKCSQGFVPVTNKNNILTCLSNMEWSQNEIFCTQAPSCGDPEDIDHGQKQYENVLVGSRVIYTCNPGYLMISKINYRECQEDGTWSGKPPVCKESVCDQIWELQEEARTCTSTPDEWIKYLQVQYLYLQIENMKLDIEIKKRQLGALSETSPILVEITKRNNKG
ncbi:sushi, von Willebrand factor type A, EGF and pentraxin domain-containing protein 1-like isoform X2 [Bufo bufo]|uniref:sushi, von Willebrand factor type A, EGF and pentraxin domain-containing protein 1-like isoform X2 n=1 Tax=Bufo bufo TaxID=8384 RepID=UPI001ABDE1FA|nr:sushi, von Willebrand factor type A, EGF and pentraxin domain-containing protein 1-like isoform X2 [Bufo bufo]